MIVGGGGVSLLNNLFQQASRIQQKDEGLELAETLLTQDAVAQDGEDR
jgi:hypothetical protein